MKADTEILSGFYRSVNDFQKTDKKISKTVERLKIPVYNGCMEKGVNNMIEAIEGFRLPRYAQIPDVGLYLEQVVRYVNTHLAPLGAKHRTPRWTECPSEDVCREVVIFSRKVLKDRVERTGRSRQADVAMDGNWSRARTD